MAEGTEEFTMPDLQDGPERTEHDVAADLVGILGRRKPAARKTEETPDPEEGSAEEESEEQEGDESPEGEEDETEEGANEEEEDSEDEEEPDAEPTADLHKVKVDGKEVEVTLDELKKSFSFEKHLTQKSQKIAEKEKYLDGEYNAVSAKQARYDELLGQLEQALGSMAPAQPDWDALRQENPIEYAVQRAEYEQYRERMAGIRAEREHVARLQQEHVQRLRAKQVAEEGQKLRSAIPGWDDPEVARKDTEAMVAYAHEQYGYSDADLADVTDHRLFVILDKARRWDERQKAKPKVMRRAAEVVKTSKPGPAALGSRKATSAQRLQKRAERTGEVEDVANLILAKGLI